MPPGFSSMSGTYWVQGAPGVGFWYSYNAGCFYANEEPMGYWWADTNGPTGFVFDEVTGQYRSSRLGPTPTRRSSWGTVKAYYR